LQVDNILSKRNKSKCWVGKANVFSNPVTSLLFEIFKQYVQSLVYHWHESDIKEMLQLQVGTQQG
jgi:hypothetical protein